MPRYQEHEAIYEVFRQFLQRCLVEDGSLLWPSRTAWTPENVKAVFDRIAGNPREDPDTDFWEKLILQMDDATREEWLILADTLYIYYLPSKSVLHKTRTGRIQWAVEQGQLPPPEDQSILENRETGFCHTGYYFNTKFRQVMSILGIAHHFKQQSPEERQRLVDNHKAFSTAVSTGIELVPDPAHRAADIGPAFLYMGFPDYFEPIINLTDKRKIVQRLGNQLEQPLPDDTDEALYKIRQSLEDEYPTADSETLHFYLEPLKSLWQSSQPKTAGPIPKEKEKPIDDVLRDVPAAIPELFDFTRNVILYGPPGTGKTYLAGRVAQWLIRAQIEKETPQSTRMERIVQDLTMYEIVALAIHDIAQSKPVTIQRIHDHPLLRARYRLRPIRGEREVIRGTLGSHADPDSETVGNTVRSAPSLFDKTPVGGWFLTANGHQYIEEMLHDRLELLDSSSPSSAPIADWRDFIEWVTFHQSYAYEDFIEGLRPLTADVSPGDISYEVVPGVFRRLCERAAADPDNCYILIIDEINRGNIAKILGELITLLEDDKRSSSAGDGTTVTLPYSQIDFSVPGNLYLIGTMNTADRSIALLDTALRRRFAFYELMPDAGLLGDMVIEQGNLRFRLADLLANLNARITEALGRDYQIGHSYLMKVRAPEDQDDTMEVQIERLAFVWNHQILPMLREYFYSQPERLEKILQITEEQSLDEALLEGEDLLAMLETIAGHDAP